MSLVGAPPGSRSKLTTSPVAFSSKLDSGDCKPITSGDSGKPIYPCGLIANSVFNGQHTSRLEQSMSFDPSS